MTPNYKGLDGKTVYMTKDDKHEYMLLHIFWVMTDWDIYCRLLDLRVHNGAYKVMRQEDLIFNLGGKVSPETLDVTSGIEVLDDNYQLLPDALIRIQDSGSPIPNIRKETLDELFKVEAEMDFTRWEDFNG